MRGVNSSKLVYGHRTRWALQAISSAFILILCIPVLEYIRAYTHSGVGPRSALVAVIGGAAFFCLCLYIMLTKSPFLLFRWLRPRLAAKMLTQYQVDTADVPMVGIAPGERVRLYGCDSSWDVGFLLLEPGRMRYLGDRAVIGLDTSKPVKLFGVKMPRVLVRWTDPSTENEEVLAIELMAGKTFGEARKRLVKLVETLDEWRRQTPVEMPDSDAAGLPPTEQGILGPNAQQRGLPGALAWVAGGLVGFAVAADVSIFGLRAIGRFSPRLHALAFAVAILGVASAILFAFLFQRVLDSRD